MIADVDYIESDYSFEDIVFKINVHYDHSSLDFSTVPTVPTFICMRRSSYVVILLGIK